ncbi:hypothetical protein F4802DRAFT_279354 [Xylaria palmicola]|nr:hypothetical protein F4802DRAFT_279354 [Xylaria palmicola]
MVLAWGNEIILASSQKGKNYFSYEYKQTPVLGSLELCQIIWRDDGPGGGTTDEKHRTEGKCGEPMAAHLYYSLDATTPLSKQQARVATVVEGRDGVQN